MSEPIERARKFAAEALQMRMVRTAPEKLVPLRERVAAVKCGRLDTAPEVQSALLAIEACEREACR